MSCNVVLSEDNISRTTLSRRFEDEFKKKKKKVIELYLSCDAICIKNLKAQRLYPFIVYMCMCIVEV